MIKRWQVVLSSWLPLTLLVTMAGAQTVQKPKELEKLRTQHQAALKELERLKQDLKHAKRDLDVLNSSCSASSAPIPADDFLLAGNAYIARQQYPQAVAAFTRAIQRAPDSAYAFRHRGIAYASQGEHRQALDDLNKAIELDPQDALAYNYLGIVYYALDDATQARSNFDSAIERQPKLAQAYNNRGMVWRQLGDYRQANKDFAAAIQLGMELAAQHLRMTRQEIKQAQERLQQAGMNPGPVDGIPGAQTIAAIEQYQKARGLPVTNLLDIATKQALELALASAATDSQVTATSLPRFVKQVNPEYPLLARQQGWEGTVGLQVEMLPEGTVGDVRVVQTSGHAILDTSAKHMAKTWTHEPMAQNGEGVTRWIDISVTYTLDDATKKEETKN